MVDIVFDDESCISIATSLLGKVGLHVGSEYDTEILKRQIEEDSFEKCYDASLHFLEYRARSEDELKQHLLKKRKFDSVSVNRTIDKLKDLKLVDDEAFAESWMQDRLLYRPKSRMMIRRELIQKGVDNEIASRITEEVDDSESAFNAGIKKAKLLRNLEYQEFYRRLAAYLGRRGYGGEVVHGAVKRAWQSISGNLTEK